MFFLIFRNQILSNFEAIYKSFKSRTLEEILEGSKLQKMINLVNDEFIVSDDVTPN
jgi:hypothetical protein